MANLYRNPNGTIARRSDGKLMRAPTQAEFEDCCCESIVPLEGCSRDYSLIRQHFTPRAWSPGPINPLAGLIRRRSGGSTVAYGWDYDYTVYSELSTLFHVNYPDPELPGDIYQHPFEMPHPEYFLEHSYGYPNAYVRGEMLYPYSSIVTKDCPPSTVFGALIYKPPEPWASEMPSQIRCFRFRFRLRYDPDYEWVYNEMIADRQAYWEDLGYVGAPFGQNILTSNVQVCFPDYPVLALFIPTVLMNPAWSGWGNIGVASAVFVDDELFFRTIDTGRVIAPPQYVDDGVSYVKSPTVSSLVSNTMVDVLPKEYAQGEWIDLKHITSYGAPPSSGISQNASYELLVYPLVTTMPTEWQNTPANVQVWLRNV